MVHHFWARFLLVKNKIKDCCDDDTVSVFAATIETREFSMPSTAAAYRTSQIWHT